MEWVFFLSATAPGLVLTIISWIYKVHPPKSINYLYGYRTRRSMRNQETWDFGNFIGAKMMFWFGISTFIAGVIAYFITPRWAMGISTFFLIVAIFAGIFWCERQLRINFDKNGRPLLDKDPSNLG